MNPTQPDLRYARRLGDWRYIPDRLNQAGERLRGYLARDGAIISLSQTSELLADLIRLIDALQAELQRRMGELAPPAPSYLAALPNRPPPPSRPAPAPGSPSAVRPTSTPAVAAAGELMHRA